MDTKFKLTAYLYECDQPSLFQFTNGKPNDVISRLEWNPSLVSYVNNKYVIYTPFLNTCQTTAWFQLSVDTPKYWYQK